MTDAPTLRLHVNGRHRGAWRADGIGAADGGRPQAAMAVAGTTTRGRDGPGRACLQPVVSIAPGRQRDLT